VSAFFSKTSQGGSSGSEAEDERQERDIKHKQEQRTRESMQHDCDLCCKPLVNRIRLARCRCALCACCVERTVLYTRQCPRCGDAPLEVAQSVVKSDLSEEEQESAAAFLQMGRQSIDGVDRQLEYLDRLQMERIHATRLVLEYGNTASPSSSTSSKILFRTFLRVLSGIGNYSAKTQMPVRRVDFNINPGYDKPTATASTGPLSSSNGSSAFDKKTKTFSFEYAMAREFPCWMTVVFDGDKGLMGWKRLVIPYQVQSWSGCFGRRIVIQLPLCVGDTTEVGPKRDIVLQRAGCNVWVRLGSHGDIEYLPNAGDSSDIGNDPSMFYRVERSISSVSGVRSAPSAVGCP